MPEGRLNSLPEEVRSRVPGERQQEAVSPPETQSETPSSPPVQPMPVAAELRSATKVDARQQTLALARVAHELKTPLAIIIGYIDLLLSGKVGPLNPRQRQVLLDTQPNCARLEKFIKDFLAYGTLDANKAAMQFERGDLNACLSETCGYWLDRYCAKGVALYFPLNPRLEPFEFDYHKIQQVVSNLVENSLKFTPQGGTVWLTAEPHTWESLAYRQAGGASSINSARVTVADTGPGIAPEFHQEIFDHFFRVPYENHPGGTGLGLAIARHIVQAHGGKIWVESEPGAGCKLTFLLPLVPGEEEDDSQWSKR